MNQNTVDLKAIWRSKLAERLIPLLVAVVAIPVAFTVLVVGQFGQEQIVKTAETIEKSNLSTVHTCGIEFKRLGQATLSISSMKMAATCLHAGRSLAQNAEHSQAESIAQCGKDFAIVAQKSSTNTTQQSLSANRKILTEINGQVGTLFATSARYTEARVADRVQLAIITQINNEMHERAEHLAQLFDDYIASNFTYLQLTAKMLSLQADNPSAQSSIIKALMASVPTLNSVNYLDSAGLVAAAAFKADDKSVITNQAFTTYYKASIKGDQYVGVDEIPVDGGAPILRLSVPVAGPNGQVIGVLSECLSLDDLWNQIRSIKIGKTGYGYVRDENGLPFLTPQHIDGAVLEHSSTVKSLGWQLVVAQSQDEVMQPIVEFEHDISLNTRHSISRVHGDILTASEIAAQKLVRDEQAVQAATNRTFKQTARSILDDLHYKTRLQTLMEQQEMQQELQTQIREEQADNDHRMSSAASLASQDLIERIPTITLRALEVANHRLALYALIILMLTSFLSCVIGFLLAGTIVRPIIQLSKGTHALALGDLEKRVDERAPAEIGDLAVAFNMMASSLQQSRADLQDAEAQVVQSAKLASLGTLSAGVAHELNQPVAIVRGLAQQLQDDPTLDSSILDDLATIERQSGRMMKIITHLRTFCRVNGYEKSALSINAVILDCFILIDAQLKAHGVDVEFHLSDDDPEIVGDRNEIEQVFINMITNARDAMEQVSGAKLVISTHVEHGQVVIEFRDSGTGVPDSLMNSIFDPFFTTKEVGKGTGLGLSISHGIIKKHGGRISVRNDGGAVFTISLPLYVDAESQIDEQDLDIKHAA